MFQAPTLHQAAQPAQGKAQHTELTESKTLPQAPLSALCPQAAPQGESLRRRGTGHALPPHCHIECVGTAVAPHRSSAVTMISRSLHGRLRETDSLSERQNSVIGLGGRGVIEAVNTLRARPRAWVWPPEGETRKQNQRTEVDPSSCREDTSAVAWRGRASGIVGMGAGKPGIRVCNLPQLTLVGFPLVAPSRTPIKLFLRASPAADEEGTSGW